MTAPSAWSVEHIWALGVLEGWLWLLLLIAATTAARWSAMMSEHLFTYCYSCCDLLITSKCYLDRRLKLARAICPSATEISTLPFAVRFLFHHPVSRPVSLATAINHGWSTTGDCNWQWHWVSLGFSPLPVTSSTTLQWPAPSRWLIAGSICDTLLTTLSSPVLALGKFISQLVDTSLSPCVYFSFI